MWQIRLKSIVGKLSILSVYLLFLFVQVNLKYTYSDASGISGSSIEKSLPSGKFSLLHASNKDKPEVKKLYLNKRYQHEDVFQIYALSNDLQLFYYKQIDKVVISIHFITPSFHSTTLLRGPPGRSVFTA